MELEDLITAASSVLHMTATLLVYMPSAIKSAHCVHTFLNI